MMISVSALIYLLYLWFLPLTNLIQPDMLWGTNLLAVIIMTLKTKEYQRFSSAQGYLLSLQPLCYIGQNSVKLSLVLNFSIQLNRAFTFYHPSIWFSVPDQEFLFMCLCLILLCNAFCTAGFTKFYIHLIKIKTHCDFETLKNKNKNLFYPLHSNSWFF